MIDGYDCQMVVICGQVSHAKMTTMTRKIAAAISVALVLSVTMLVSPAAAWAPLYTRWASSNTQINVCKGSGWSSITSAAWGTVHAAIFRWNNYSYGQPVFVDSPSMYDCEYFVDINNTQTNPAQTATVVSNGIILSARTNFYLAAANSYWWYTAVQDCWVGSGNGCKMDAFTMALHEAGHALGLSHNTNPAGDQRCSPGFYSTNSDQACDYYGKAVMHWNSGAEYLNGYFGHGYAHQGYRHAYPTADDLGALAQY